MKKNIVVASILIIGVLITVLSFVRYGIDFWGWMWIALCLAAGLTIGISIYRLKKK